MHLHAGIVPISFFLVRGVLAADLLLFSTCVDLFLINFFHGISSDDVTSSLSSFLFQTVCIMTSYGNLVSSYLYFSSFLALSSEISF